VFRHNEVTSSPPPSNIHAFSYTWSVQTGLSTYFYVTLYPDKVTNWNKTQNIAQNVYFFFIPHFSTHSPSSLKRHRLSTSHPFWTEYNANHYDYWAVPHGKPKVKEQRKSSIKTRFKVTLVTRYTWAESLLSERRKLFSLRPMFREILEDSCDLLLLDVKENLGSRDSDSLRAGRSGDRIPVGARFSAPIQDRLRGPPSLLYNGYRVFPGG
jgi:hypothetical protein